MNVVFDMDGTICRSQETMLLLANQRLKPPLEITDWLTYNPRDCFSAEQYSALRAVWTTDAVYQNTTVYPGIKELINELYENHTITIWTFNGDNSENLAVIKKNFIERNGINYHNFVVSRSDKSTLPFKIDVIIEDSFQNLKNIHASNKILVTRPWNDAFDVGEVECSSGGGVFRASDSMEMSLIIRSIVQCGQNK